MSRIHDDWRNRIVNMGEAPEVTIPPENCEAIRAASKHVANTIESWLGESLASVNARNPAFDAAIDAVTAARQQAGLASYDGGWSPQHPPFAVERQEAMMRNYATVLDISMTLPSAVTRESIDTFLGRSWASKVRRRQRWAGTYAVAKQLRKQGVGLLVARLLLLGRA